MSQQSAPTTAIAAATAKDVVQPNLCAIHGVREAVRAPPICPPILTRDEITPESRPAISTETDQKLLCERYSAPAPPARMNPASCGLRTCDPITRKIAVRQSANEAR